MGSPSRALARMIVYLGWTAALLPVQIVAVWFGLPLARRLPGFYHRNCCRILGFELRVTGTLSTVRPTLFVCNHTSYVDVEVLGALIEGSFVAKSEVASWPFFGMLARLQRTVFVDRRISSTATQRDDIGRRLEANDNLILFPEGTSADGTRVLPFKSALLAVAERRVRHQPVQVQPVSIAYTRLDGIPMGRTLRPFVAWYGDMGMLAHCWAMLGLGTVTVDVVFHPTVTIAALGSRKALAEHCQQIVAAGVAASNAGRLAETYLPALAG